jgi:hypothetical protein
MLAKNGGGAIGKKGNKGRRKEMKDREGGEICEV